MSQCTRQTDIILWTQNIQNEVLFPAQKLTSEENLLVGVESVDDEGEELVDISREGVAFSVGGLLAEGRGIRKNVWRVARKTGTSAVRCCVVKNYEREDNEGHEMHNPQSSWQESRARGWIWLGARRSHQPPHDRHPPRPTTNPRIGIYFHLLCPPGSKTAQDVSLTPVIGAKHRRSRADTQHPKRGGGLTMVAKGWVAISNGWGVVCDLRLPKENKRLLPANE